MLWSSVGLLAALASVYTPAAAANPKCQACAEKKEAKSHHKNGLGFAQVVNRCDFNITAYSVGQMQHGPYVVEPGTTWAEQLFRDAVVGGIAIKVLPTPQSPNTNALSGAHTVFAYNVNQPVGNLNYDLTNIFTPDVFAGHRMHMSAGPGCPSVTWPDGRSTGPAGSACNDVYNNLTLTIC